MPIAGCLGVPDLCACCRVSGSSGSLCLLQGVREFVTFLCQLQGVWVFLTFVPVAGCLGVPDLCVQEERAPHPGEEEEQAL